ncbi:hypothetical protein AB6A40_008240 [Gnathostoma spinigerum]|uniref:Uncharacterized protein n=1 Tax=Gnathostoma spinigerum TaxID=75299 RepID=A0ABD6ENY7_9BILA
MVCEYLGNKSKGVTVSLLACEEIFLADTSAVSCRVDERERSAQQFLDIATTQKMLENGDHLVFGRKSYNLSSKESRQLPSGNVLVDGLEKNVRFLGDSWDSAKAVVQIDSKKAAFFKEQPLIDLVSALCRGTPWRISTDDKCAKLVARQLKDLTVRTTHLPKIQKVFCIFGITKDSAEKQMIKIEDGQISVADYYFRKYLIRLRHAELPCVVERRVNRAGVSSSYYPVELLEVVGGQRVDLKKQTPELVEQLIRGCRLSPTDLMQENDRQRSQASLDNNNPFLKRLGIRIVDEAMKAPASTLCPPAIQYLNSRVEPASNGVLDWRLSAAHGFPEKMFIKPAKPPRRWVVFIMKHAIDKAFADQFITSYMSRAKIHGLILPKVARMEMLEQTDSESLLEKMNGMRKNGVEFVLFITREKKDPIHDELKLLEIKCKVVTQNVSSQTVQKVLNARGAELVLDNILMKTNLKLGGVNHALVTSKVFISHNALPVVEKQWLTLSRMFIGLEMSHAAPQSLFARQSGLPPSEPTIVGMAYSCGNPYYMMGTYWMQQPRKVIITDLKEQVLNALMSYKESDAKQLPSHIVVYRGGVSDGDFIRVMNEEAQEIREAIEVATNNSSSKIRLTIIVVQAHSNYRIFKLNPGQGNAAQQNVPPGTCIDQNIMHPTQTEFILVPHKAIQGCARPIRCTVVVDDEPRMSLEEVEGMTNSLCYMHGIVTSPVSLPAFLYSASSLAKRGRANWKTANDNDDKSVSSGMSDDRRCGDDSDDFFGTLSKEFVPSLRHKFWA